MILFIPLVRKTVIAEWHVADRKIEEAVGQIRVLKPLNLDVRALIELLGDAPGQTVQLNAVQLAVFHAFRQHSEEIADTASGFQYVAGTEAHVFDRLIDRSDHGRGGIVCVQHRTAR